MDVCVTISTKAQGTVTAVQKGARLKANRAFLARTFNMIRPYKLTLVDFQNLMRLTEAGKCHTASWDLY